MASPIDYTSKKHVFHIDSLIVRDPFNLRDGEDKIGLICLENVQFGGGFARL